MSVANIQIRPHKVTIGKAVAQVQSIKTVPDVSSSLQNKYFLFKSAAGVKHYAWLNVGGAGVDPAPAGGWTGHEVAISANASATAIATALAAVLTAVSGFDATASGNVVELTCTATGFAEPAYDAASPSATGFSFKVLTLGQAPMEAGCIFGDIEVSGFEQSKVEILCHETGTTVRDERISGYSKPAISFILQDTSKAAIEKILQMYGMYGFTPVGADKETVFGYGPSQVGGSNPKVYINLHPVSLDASDKSEDWNLWTCELALESFTFSGENVSQIPATFNIYPDESKPKAIQFFMIGDAAKAGY